MLGGDGADVLCGNARSDIVAGGGGADWIHGGDGGELVLGGAGNDTLFGGSGSDVAVGGFGDDLLIGGDGWDEVAGQEGSDTLIGGSGNDRFVFDVTVADSTSPDGSVRNKSWLDSDAETFSVDVVTDFTVGYVNDDDTLVFRLAGDGADRIHSAAQLDDYVTVREFGHDVVIIFDKDGLDNDPRAPLEDVIVFAGVGSGSGLIDSLQALVQAHWNVEVVTDLV